MTWSQIKRNAIRQAALDVLADVTASELDHEAAQRALTTTYDYSRLNLAELNLMERLERRLAGQSDTPVVLDKAPASNVAHGAGCARCEGLSDEDLDVIRTVVNEDRAKAGSTR